MKVTKKAKTSKRGPKPETVKIEGDWEEAVKTALDKKRPAEGWPDSKEDPKSETSKQDK